MQAGRKRIDWNFHIEQQARSGLSIKEYCQREGFSSWSFYTRRKKIHDRFTLQKQVPQKPLQLPNRSLPPELSFLSMGALQRPSVTVRFPDTTVVEFTTTLTPEHLAVLIKALKSRSKKENERC